MRGLPKSFVRPIDLGSSMLFSARELRKRGRFPLPSISCQPLVGVEPTDEIFETVSFVEHLVQTGRTP